MSMYRWLIFIPILAIVCALGVNAFAAAHEGWISLQKHLSERQKASRALSLLETLDPSRCDRADDPPTCLEKYYRTLVRAKGVKSAIDDLRSRYEVDPYVKADCNPLAHVIGREAVEIYSTISEAYIHGDSICWDGYYHGVMEAVAERIEFKGVVEQINDLCADIPDRDMHPLFYFYCVHGIGHGLMAVTNDELFDSLAACDKLQGTWEQQSCSGGVFMENIISNDSGHKTKYLDPAEPQYPCSASPVKYKEQCYLQQSSYMFNLANRDFGKTFDLCSMAPGAYANTCYESVGRDASGEAKDDPARILALCEKGKNFEQISHCVSGVVDFLESYESQSVVRNFCDITGGDLKATCTSRALQYQSL